MLTVGAITCRAFAIHRILLIITKFSKNLGNLSSVSPAELETIKDKFCKGQLAVTITIRPFLPLFRKVRVKQKLLRLTLLKLQLHVQA